MGVKRPSGEENLPELSFKQPKQLDDSIQTPMYMTKELPSDALRVDCAGEPNTNSCEIQISGALESGETLCVYTADNDSERTSDRVEDLSKSEQNKQLGDNIKLYSSGPFSSTTTSDEEEEYSGIEYFLSSHTLPVFHDISKSSRLPYQYLDPYVSSLNSSPCKEVPVGPDHQADLPNWDPLAHQRLDSLAHDVRSGICVIPMPSVYILGSAENAAGHGRKDCSCRDVGSTRCVRQHVSEARERLQESFRHMDFKESFSMAFKESFSQMAFQCLGFFNMGEEVVARDWSPDEQRLFRKVVASSPLSRGQNFWELLSFVFPNRSKDAFVRFYFNVFMLRRRAFQNRSYMLHVDSDDDETPYGDDDDDDDGKGFGVGGDGDGDGDGMIHASEDEEWTDDRDLDVGWNRDYRPKLGNFDREEGSDRTDRWDNFGMGAGKGEGF